MANCLVIIDVQRGFISEQTSHIPSRMIELLNKEKIFDHVVGTKFINHPNSPFTRFLDWQELLTPDSQEVIPSVADRCERIFKKENYSCFTDEFKSFLAENQIAELFLAGLDTEGCVLKSALDSFEHNINVHILANYCASGGGQVYHDAAITILERTLGEKAIDFLP